MSRHLWLVSTCVLLLAMGCVTTHRSDRFMTKESRAHAAATPADDAAPEAIPGVTAFALEEEAADADAPVLELHFIEVGQGDCTLVQCPNGENILVDCGSTGKFQRDPVREYLRDALGEEPMIDLLVVTHPDRDHYNKITTVLEEEGAQPAIGVGRVVFVGAVADHDAAHSGDFDQWLTDFPSDQRESLDPAEFNVFPAVSLDVCGEVDVRVLAAGVTETASGLTPSNAQSIVLLLTFGSFDVMLTGDATRSTHNDILERFEDHLDELGRVEVLKVSHHGSLATSTLMPPSQAHTRWFDAIEPELAIFSASATNGFGHPNLAIAQAIRGFTFEVEDHDIQLWEKGGVPGPQDIVDEFRTEAMFLTATNGNITVTSDGIWYEWAWER